MVASIVPGVTPHQAMWEIPFVTVSYYMVQAARRAGVKGIEQREKSIKLWRKFAELHKDELDAERKRYGLLKQSGDLAENLAEESIRQDDIKQRENDRQGKRFPQK